MNLEKSPWLYNLLIVFAKLGLGVKDLTHYEVSKCT